VAAVLWLRGQSWWQSWYVGCVGLETLSWPLFFSTSSTATLHEVVVKQGRTRHRLERLRW